MIKIGYIEYYKSLYFFEEYQSRFLVINGLNWILNCKNTDDLKIEGSINPMYIQKAVLVVIIKIFFFIRVDYILLIIIMVYFDSLTFIIVMGMESMALDNQLFKKEIKCTNM